MIDDPALCQTLSRLGKAMAIAREPWWIISSAAAALHGAREGAPGDVDVLLSPADACHILPSLGLAVSAGEPHRAFRSQIFATWRACPLPVEFMAGFAHRCGGEWQPVTFTSRQCIAIGGIDLFVPDRAELRALLLRFGRSKDLARARALDALD